MIYLYIIFNIELTNHVCVNYIKRRLILNFQQNVLLTYLLNWSSIRESISSIEIDLNICFRILKSIEYSI